MAPAASRPLHVLLAGVPISWLAACAGAHEPNRVELPVHVGGAMLEAVQTNLGYEVQLYEARLALSDLEFAVGGEAHARWWRGLEDYFVPVAKAHPGHSEGGEVTGELRGRFVTSWLPRADAPLGTATLLEGDYESANFTLARATMEDGLAANDPLLGHTALLRGVARRSGTEREFVALIDADGALTGVPFAVPVRGGMNGALGLELLPRDPFERDTLFDGIDFERLAPAGESVHISREHGTAAMNAHETLRGALHGPDHFTLGTLP